MFPKRSNIQKPVFNLALGTKVAVLKLDSIMAQFQSVDCTYFDGDEKCVAKSYVDDIYMLFNQQRLLSCGKDTIQAWLNTLQPRSDALAELRKKCTDEQLMQICKSRYIQSPSELLAWSEYLNANYERIVVGMQKSLVQSEHEPAETESTQSSAQSE